MTEPKRSDKWPEVEKAHRELEPKCAVCGKGVEDGVKLQVHHVFPFHYCIAFGRPDLELDQRNLITLCEGGEGDNNHHLLVGHLDDFQSSNLNVREDAAGQWHGMGKEEIEKNPAWLQAKANRLPLLEKMTEADKKEFIDRMNATYGPKEENG